jgi:geranylgeranyl pyrophosphate synthase
MSLEPSELKNLLRQRSEEVINKFKQISFSEIRSTSDLTDVLERTKLQWGEYTRPAIVSLCCEVVGGKPSSTYDASVAITTIAAGLAIHDDIIDKTKDKHFKKTILSSQSPERALLIGDMLIIKGLFEVGGDLRKVYSEKIADSIIKQIYFFIFELYDGEFMEVSFQKNLAASIDDYLIMKKKLTADIPGCARIGAIIGAGSQMEVQALSNFGSRLGFVANLADEVKDSMNREGNLADRLRYESVPLPLVYAAKSSHDSYLKATSLLKKRSVAPDEIRKLCWETKAIDFVYQTAKYNADCAIKELEQVRPNAAKDILISLLMIPLLYIESEREFESVFTDSL